MFMSKSLLIVCYKFPPDQSIGGKRWSKFAKYLSLEGNDVHILCQQNKEFPRKENYNGIKIHEFKSHYPQILSSNPISLKNKLHYRFWKFLMHFIFKGSIYDRSLLSKNNLKKKATEILRSHKIDTVIVSVAPFNAAMYIAELKIKYSFKLIIDFRDPWTWGESYGYSVISNKRLRFDQQLERKTINTADFIITPAQSILNHLKLVYKNSSEPQFKLIPHGVDTLSISRKFNSKMTIRAKNEFKLIYAGTLYDGYETYMVSLLEAFENLKKELNIIVKLDVYSLNNTGLLVNQMKNRNLLDSIKINKPIPENEIMKKIQEADFSLIYFPRKYKDFISTKFYEILYVKTPIIFVGDNGLVSEFILDNNLGFHLTQQDLQSKLINLFKKLKSEGFTQKSDFDASKFSFINITNQLKKII